MFITRSSLALVARLANLAFYGGLLKGAWVLG